ncbi:uncharacterized protein LOC144491771 [Mustelus asterias]
MNEKRRQRQEMQRIERQRSLSGHENCNQPQAVLQAIKAHGCPVSQQVVQSSLQPLSSRLRGMTLCPKPLMFPPAIKPLPETSPGELAVKPVGISPIPARPVRPEDPRNRSAVNSEQEKITHGMFFIVRETYAPPKMPVPTPLEERLLKERFPNYKIPFIKHNPRLIERKIFTPILDSICIPEKQQTDPKKFSAILREIPELCNSQKAVESEVLRQLNG